MNIYGDQLGFLYSTQDGSDCFVEFFNVEDFKLIALSMFLVRTNFLRFFR